MVRLGFCFVLLFVLFCYCFYCYYYCYYYCFCYWLTCSLFFLLLVKFDVAFMLCRFVSVKLYIYFVDCCCWLLFWVQSTLRQFRSRVRLGFCFVLFLLLLLLFLLLVNFAVVVMLCRFVSVKLYIYFVDWCCWLWFVGFEKTPKEEEEKEEARKASLEAGASHVDCLFCWLLLFY